MTSVDDLAVHRGAELAARAAAVLRANDTGVMVIALISPESTASMPVATGSTL